MIILTAIGLASIFLCIGMFLRAKICFFQKMLIPSSIIAGMLGLIFINFFTNYNFFNIIDTNLYSEIVNQLFIVSFISISLTNNTTKETPKDMLKGATGMGIVWCLLYSLTPAIGALFISLIGNAFYMNPHYGLLIPFAFTQGPGQAASFGQLFEHYGWPNAQAVALTFSSVGFLVAFSVGIPAVKLGINKGIAKNCKKLDKTVLKGYLLKNEQINYMIRDTTCSSNIETLSFHVALIGLCYILASVISEILSLIPGFLGESMSSLMFMNGMYAAYIVRFFIKKLKIDFLHDNILQTKITGLSADYLVICAFMSVNFITLKHWLIPILLESLLILIITFLVCFYFGQRFGGDNDFERTLGLFGTATGTVPSGIALVRIVDSEFKTSTSTELGLMNIIMTLCTPTYLVILATASGTFDIWLGVTLLLILSFFYLLLLKLTKTWGKKTYSWK